MENTDARMNLYNAFLYAAAEGSRGVSLVFDGKVISGTRARKERTKSFNAFSSVDYPELAIIRDGRLIRYLAELDHRDGPEFFHRLEERVLLLTLIPGMGADALSALRDSYQAVILQSFGVGGVPGGGSGPFARAMEDWLQAGKTIVMMTQVPYEGSDMAVYQVGYQVKEKYQLMEAYNMTLEAAATKLMWVLGQTRDSEEVGHHSMNRDRGRDGGRSSSSWDSRMEACLCCPGSRGLRQSTASKRRRAESRRSSVCWPVSRT